MPCAPPRSQAHHGVVALAGGSVEVPAAAATGLPSLKQVHALVKQATALLAAGPALVDLEVPVGAQLHVVGDIHGQLPELHRVLEICGPPEEGRNLLLFNGDFVDRGPQSVEVMVELLSLLVAHPSSVVLNRGNHETRAMNRHFGFEREVYQKFRSKDLFEAFQDLFSQLPYATVVNKSVLVLHGGLPSSDGVRLADIASLPRGQHQLRGLAHELLWADPSPHPGRHRSPRGASIQLFGPDVAERFCQDNGLLCCIRSHEVAMGGFAMQQGGRCITVFSAANYVGQVGNLGAVCHIRPSMEGSVVQEDLDFSTFEGASASMANLMPRSRL